MPPHRDRPRAAAEGPQDDLNLKVGIIASTYEDFKIMTEKELFDIMTQMRQALETDGSNIPRIPRPQIHGLPDPFGMYGGPLGRVDEIDDMDALNIRNPNPYLEIIRLHEQNNDLLGGQPLAFPAFLNRDHHWGRGMGPDLVVPR